MQIWKCNFSNSSESLRMNAGSLSLSLSLSLALSLSRSLTLTHSLSLSLSLSIALLLSRSLALALSLSRSFALSLSPTHMCIYVYACRTRRISINTYIWSVHHFLSHAEALRFKRAAFYNGLKSKVGLAAAKAAALRINLNVHGCSIVAPPMLAFFFDRKNKIRSKNPGGHIGHQWPRGVFSSDLAAVSALRQNRDDGYAALLAHAGGALYGTELGSVTLKRIGFFCFPIKHSTHT